MTIKEKFKSLLINSGMFDVDAEVVMQIVMNDDANKAMEGRWNDSVEGYPDVLFNVLWASVCINAVEWIDENKPLAWYRPLFVLD